MTADRVLEPIVLGAMACLGILGIGRAVILSARGVRLVTLDRRRTILQALTDLGFVLCFVLWVYEVLAFTVPLGFHVVPAAVRATVLTLGAARIAGVLVMAAGLLVYALALHALGSSWRLTIDRDRPGALVRDGVFGRSRNPVYLGLIALAVGVFLVLGRLVLLVLAIVFVGYFELLIRREERFLAGQYGDAYREYARSVGRWWTWRSRDGEA